MLDEQPNYKGQTFASEEAKTMLTLGHPPKKGTFLGNMYFSDC